MSKQNPRRIPRSQADVDKAEQAGFERGISGSLAIMLYTLKDKFGATDEELKEFNDAFRYTVDGIQKGYVKEKDLTGIIKDEYGWEIQLK